MYFSETNPLTQTIENPQKNDIPEVRRVRNALVQVWIRGKFFALLNPPIPQIKSLDAQVERRNPEGIDRRSTDRWIHNNIWRRHGEIKVLSIVTATTLEGIVKLLEQDKVHHAFIIHEQSVIWWAVTVKSLQNQWYKVSFVAEDWRTTWKYIIEKELKSVNNH